MVKINVQNTAVNIVRHNDEDYISLTDMARSQMQEHIIFRWLSLKGTIEYLGEWKCCIIQTLIVPNSVQLEMLQEATILCFR